MITFPTQLNFFFTTNGNYSSSHKFVRQYPRFQGLRANCSNSRQKSSDVPIYLLIARLHLSASMHQRSTHRSKRKRTVERNPVMVYDYFLSKVQVLVTSNVRLSESYSRPCLPENEIRSFSWVYRFLTTYMQDNPRFRLYCSIVSFAIGRP